MYVEIARAKQIELFSNPLQMALRAEVEEFEKLNRLQRSMSVARARLGLQPVAAN